MELNDYQDAAQLTDQRPGVTDEALIFPLMGLASEIGSLVNQYKKRVRDGDAHALFSDRVAEELGDVLWYVANVTAKLNLKLDEDVASLNLRRIRERWVVEGEVTPSRLFDEDFPADEQLPRNISVSFAEHLQDGRNLVQITHEGQQIGDYLTDMSWDDDDYRYHDAFHLTYAAILGWSPVLRAMLRRQRGSDTRYREIEDSGRAKVVEEAISAIVFEYASDEQFLKSVRQLDTSLLETVRNMAARYEVRVRSITDWERAIIRSFDMWRELRDHQGGTLHLDLVGRQITFEPRAE